MPTNTDSLKADKPGVYISTDTAMARHVGLERQEFYNFKKRDGGTFPKKTSQGWDVNEVRTYLTVTGRIDGQVPEGAPDYYIERARKMKADADRQELEVKRINGELLPASEVYASWSKQVNDIDQVMKKTNAALARKLAGLDTPAILLKLNDAWHDARETMSDMQ